MFKVFIKQNKPNNRNFKFKIKRKFLDKESGNGILKLSRVRPRIALCKPCNRNTYYQCTSLTVIARWKFLNEPESCREGLIHALLVDSLFFSEMLQFRSMKPGPYLGLTFHCSSICLLHAHVS